MDRPRNTRRLTSFACFDCRKSFKQPVGFPARNPGERHVCPECGREMTEMGKYFAAPRKDDIEQWKMVKALVDAGFRFHSESEVRTYPEHLRDVAAFIEEARTRHGQLSEGEELLRRLDRKQQK